jgi:hypothetical protein
MRDGLLSRTKGINANARRGEIKHFTGIDDAYEAPELPEIVRDTVSRTAEEKCQDNTKSPGRALEALCVLAHRQPNISRRIVAFTKSWKHKVRLPKPFVRFDLACIVFFTSGPQLFGRGFLNL